jgi:hypothetical protein
LDIWNVSGLALFIIFILKPFKTIATDFKYKYYKRRSSKHKVFYIHEEPNRNKYCEPFSTRRSFIANFIDHKQNVRFTFFMDYHLSEVRSTIEKLNNNLLFNISKCNELQDYLEANPLDHGGTKRYEEFNHVVKEDMSSIRKLESFLMRYDSSYIPKPEYAGEERDNVNTY